MSKVGKRVRLIKCNDPWTTLNSGEEGTIEFVDDMGTVHVQWDNGHTLGLCKDAGDRWVEL